jgi:hypothetical protein
VFKVSDRSLIKLAGAAELNTIAIIKVWKNCEVTCIIVANSNTFEGPFISISTSWPLDLATLKTVYQKLFRQFSLSACKILSLIIIN